MTLQKPTLDPAKLKPTSGRKRMTIDHPVRIVKKPTASAARGLLGAVAATDLLARRHDPSDPAAMRKFNPNEPRRPDGKWGVGGAVKDALKLADRIELGKDEKLVASDRISPKGGHDVDTLFAVVDSPHGRRIRIGIIPTHDAGKWRAANKGGTVNLTPDSVARLRDDLTRANTDAKRAAAKADADWKAGRHPDLTQAIAEGSIPSDWGDLRYNVHLTDDDPTSWLTTLEAGTDAADGSAFYPKDLQKLLSKLAGFASTPSVQRAAGHDTTPGHDELHHYWTKGPGLAKWAESPTPWTTLYHHLLKYMSPERAKRAASAWFEEVMGFASGSDLNRVTHGKPPRGKLVGPG